LDSSIGKGESGASFYIPQSHSRKEVLMATFYITGLYHTEKFNDRTLPPIEVEANGRLEAMTRIGATVWTEAEFQELKEDGMVKLEPVPVRPNREVKR